MCKQKIHQDKTKQNKYLSITKCTIFSHRLKVMRQQKTSPAIFSQYFCPVHRDQNQKSFW